MGAQQLQSLSHEQLVALVRGTVSVGGVHVARRESDGQRTAA